MEQTLMKKNRWALAGLKMMLICLGLFLQGCTRVQPWDKENFTKASMSMEPWSVPEYMNNKTIEKALESSRGGLILGGGGCGCG